MRDSVSSNLTDSVMLINVSYMVVMVQLVKILRCGRGVLSSSLSDHMIYACEQRLRRDLISLLQEF